MPDWSYLQRSPITEQDVVIAAYATMPDDMISRLERLIWWRRKRKAEQVAAAYLHEHKIRIMYEIRNRKEQEATQ